MHAVKAVFLKWSSQKKEVTYRHKDWLEREVQQRCKLTRRATKWTVRTIHGLTPSGSGPELNIGEPDSHLWRSADNTEQICRQPRAGLQTKPSRTADNTKHIYKQRWEDLKITLKRPVYITEHICRQNCVDLHTTPRKSVDITEQKCR